MPLFCLKTLIFLKFGGENSNLAEFYSRFGGKLSISSGTAALMVEKVISEKGQEM